MEEQTFNNSIITFAESEECSSTQKDNSEAHTHDLGIYNNNSNYYKNDL